MKRLLILLPLLVSCSATDHPSRSIEIDASAPRAVLDILTAMKGDASFQKIDTSLDSLLNTRPYQTMFTHYNRSWRPNHLPESVFKRMVLSLRFADQYQAGENSRADQMFPKWERYYEDLESFRDNLAELESIDLQQLIDGAVSQARSWLPPEMTLPESYFFIHPNGGSSGFAIGQSQGYDFFQMARDDAGHLLLNEFAEVVAHECHHLGLGNYSRPPTPTAVDSLARTFLLLFVGEGTATKFINNAGGGRVPRIDTDRTNTSIDPTINELTTSLWQQYSDNEEAIFEKMAVTFRQIIQGNMTQNELFQEIRDYWISGIIGRNYFLGSELFGAIYFGFGKEGCFQAMRDPRTMFDLYNRSLEKRADLLNQCVPIPQEIVREALAIKSSDGE